MWVVCHGPARPSSAGGLVPPKMRADRPPPPRPRVTVRWWGAVCVVCGVVGVGAVGAVGIVVESKVGLRLERCRRREGAVFGQQVRNCRRGCQHNGRPQPVGRRGRVRRRGHGLNATDAPAPPPKLASFGVMKKGPPLGGPSPFLSSPSERHREGSCGGLTGVNTHRDRTSGDLATKYVTTTPFSTKNSLGRSPLLPSRRATGQRGPPLLPS